MKNSIKSFSKIRVTAIITGASLLLMAVFAGIAFSVLGTFTATIGLVGIFILDIVTSIGIYRYHQISNPKWTFLTAFLRLIYTCFFGWAISFHISGNLDMFQFIWGIGLITFGFHLLALGVLFNNEGGRKWINGLIKLLLILAGIGYVILNVGKLVIDHPKEFTDLMNTIFIIPMIFGEVFYALWMIIQGGRNRK